VLRQRIIKYHYKTILLCYNIDIKQELIMPGKGVEKYDPSSEKPAEFMSAWAQEETSSEKADRILTEIHEEGRPQRIEAIKETLRKVIVSGASDEDCSMYYSYSHEDIDRAIDALETEGVGKGKTSKACSEIWALKGRAEIEHRRKRGMVD
jgi:hypothetical protein